MIEILHYPRTLNYGNDGIFRIMGNAGFISSAVWKNVLGPLWTASGKGPCDSLSGSSRLSVLGAIPIGSTVVPFWDYLIGSQI